MSKQESLEEREMKDGSIKTKDLKTTRGKLQRKVDTLDYIRLLLIWLGGKPEKRTELSKEELEDAVGLVLSKPRATPLAAALAHLKIIKEGGVYSLPEHEYVFQRIEEFNAEERRKERIFGRPPLLIKCKL